MEIEQTSKYKRELKLVHKLQRLERFGSFAVSGVWVREKRQKSSYCPALTHRT